MLYVFFRETTTYNTIVLTCHPMATLTGAFLFRIPARDLHVGHYPFTTCLVN